MEGTKHPPPWVSRSWRCFCAGPHHPVRGLALTSCVSPDAVEAGGLPSPGHIHVDPSPACVLNLPSPPVLGATALQQDGSDLHKDVFMDAYFA